MTFNVWYLFQGRPSFAPIEADSEANAIAACPYGKGTAYAAEPAVPLVRPGNYTAQDVVPADLPNGFLQALEPYHSQIEIRVHFPPHAEAQIQRDFSNAGVALPAEIQALEPGKRGGTTVQRTWAASVWFPAVHDNFTPAGSKPTGEGDLMVNNHRDVVLALLKAGFEITTAKGLN